VNGVQYALPRQLNPIIDQLRQTSDYDEWRQEILVGHEKTWPKRDMLKSFTLPKAEAWSRCNAVL